ncbi:MAG: hypothetical protein ABJB16_08320 [Saprospiraceae bacterium]
MPCFAVVIALLFPRVVIAVLWFMTHWFNGVFDSILWLVLGFIFMPFTTLWYSVVINHYGGNWSNMNIAVMVLAVVIDLGSTGGGFKSRRR